MACLRWPELHQQPYVSFFRLLNPGANALPVLALSCAIESCVFWGLGLL